MAVRIEAEGLVLKGWGPDAGWTTGRQDLVLAVRLPDGRLVETRDRPKVPVERWIVPGQTVPVSIDPDKPKKCDVLVDGVTPLPERMAGRDWALLNLEEVAAVIRVARWDLGMSAAAQQGLSSLDPTARAIEERSAFERAWTKQAAYPQEPVRDGKGRLRGVAHLISFEERPSSRDGGQPDSSGWKGKRLFRVWLHGYGPYAAMDEAKFHRSGNECYLNGGVPVAVKPDDIYDVEFLWDEWSYDPQAALRERALAEQQTAAQQAQALVGQHADMLRQMGYDPKQFGF